MHELEVSFCFCLFSCLLMFREELPKVRESQRGGAKLIDHTMEQATAL